MTGSSKVIFIDSEVEKAFNSLADNDPIKKALIRAFQNIKEDLRLSNKRYLDLQMATYKQK